ncbi:hypothetical protein Tco_1514096, partial [Tanacetum coccineum]
GGRRSAWEGTKALVAWIDEVTVSTRDLHLLRDSLADDSEEESPVDDSNVVDGYMVDNESASVVSGGVCPDKE